MPKPEADAVQSFIAATFRSVWALELLCLLRSNRDVALSQADMVAGLTASQLVVSQSLASLVAAGLVVEESDGSARYAPASQSLDALAQAAEEFYANRPNAVRRIIVSASRPSIAAFADAFRLKKD